MKGSLSFRLRSEFLDVVTYFGLYKFSSRVYTDAVLTPLASHRYEEENWEKTAVKNRSLANEFRFDEVYSLSEDAVQAKEHSKIV